MRKGWSIDPAHWSGLSHALQESSLWRSVLLTPNDRHMVPDRPGIYAICARPPIFLRTTYRTLFDSLASPIYIGRSESSILTRFLRHCNTKDHSLLRAKQCYDSAQLRFWFVEIPSASVRDAEGWLIDCFGPPANQRRGNIVGTIGTPIDA